ncbi:MAG TPA: N-acetyltransferase [Candidatus Excrementavichristensenella intestinipullorum]|nr:N-acetyltransferase [Candidatus Excrementavichristensenella intestinipullorum]
MLIRAMTPQDWPQVARIFQQGIDDGNATLHPHVPAYPDWDRSRDPEPRLVAEEAGRVLGWTALSPVSGRACYRGVKELAIYVERPARGRGVGTALLNALIAQSEAMGIWMLEAHILEGNRASLALHSACGFRRVGLRERIGADKQGRWHSTVLMERRSRLVEWEEEDAHVH